MQGNFSPLKKKAIFFLYYMKKKCVFSLRESVEKQTLIATRGCVATSIVGFSTDSLRMK